MSDWDPSLYLRFKEERTRPSRDLVARIPTRHPRSVLDVGCGPGNSTQVLREAFPAAEITGLDSSPEMIARAETDYPDGRWICADAASHPFEESFDVVYSNAVLQWIPGQERVLNRLIDLLAPGATLAVQVPANDTSPIHLATVEVARREEWADLTADRLDWIQYRNSVFYYEILSGRGLGIDLWVTTYMHVLDSQRGLIDWYRSTGMKHYLAALPDAAARERFTDLVFQKIVTAYPVETDGKVLFPFRRLFFTGHRSV